MTEVLPLPASKFYRRQVVSFVNIGSSYSKQYHVKNFIQFSLRLTTVPSCLVTNVSSNNRFSCSSDTFSYTSLVLVEEEDYDSNYNNNNADLFAKRFVMIKPCATRNPSIRRNNLVNTLSRILSYGLLFAFTITVHTLYARNSALAATYDRMGGSLSSSSSLTSCPSIHVNIVPPQSLQLFPSLAIMILANLFSILKPLLNQLMISQRNGSVIFFQVAVSDKKRALRRKLVKIAKHADTSTLDGLNYVLKEVVNALHYNKTGHLRRNFYIDSVVNATNYDGIIPSLLLK